MASVSEHRVAPQVQRVGVVVHPSRNIERPLDRLRSWAQERGVSVVQVQVPIAGPERMVAEPGEPDDCDLLVSIGGDGTMLAAIRAAVAADLPVLGVTCGSLGVLTSVTADGLPAALERFRQEDWTPRVLPALTVARSDGPDLFAVNDVCVVRDGIGQVRVTSRVDGVLFTRLAGDGCVVSTATGSSAYALAAGGPLLTPEADAYLLTPLATHGGFSQPLVIAGRSQLTLEIATGVGGAAGAAGVGGARLEIDGQIVASDPQALTIGLRPGVATLVGFADQEPLFHALRRRQIITDSPRVVADAPRLD
ncbi:MAG: NAD(+)/NADH kinase [Gaiellales bacterium]